MVSLAAQAISMLHERTTRRNTLIWSVMMIVYSFGACANANANATIRLSTFGASISLNGEYAVYVHIPQVDREFAVHQIDVHTDWTIGDLLECVRSIVKTLERIHNEDIIISVSGETFSKTGPLYFTTLLSDAGVGSDSVVDISWSSLDDLTDIQLLFSFLWINDMRELHLDIQRISSLSRSWKTAAKSQ